MRRSIATLVAALVVIPGAAGVSAASGATPRGAKGSSATPGMANVAYAGSLAFLNEKVLGPAFTRATHLSYEGRGAGSDALSEEIRSGEIAPNVFESVGAAPVVALEPRFAHWYIEFAASPLVVAYSPSSRFAPELAAIRAGRRPLRDLFSLLASPGFRLGRTDPNLDPQGAAFVEMVELAQRRFHLPTNSVRAILGGAPGSASSAEIFDETALEPRLEAGQLDAASAFLSQAVQLHLHYIALPSSIDLGEPRDAAAYAEAAFTLSDGVVEHGRPLVLDITTIGTRDHDAAAAFVAYVLSPAGRAIYARGGYRLLAPLLVGRRADVPAKVLDELPT